MNAVVYRSMTKTKAFVAENCFYLFIDFGINDVEGGARSTNPVAVPLRKWENK